MTGSYEEIAESTELTETENDQQSAYVKLGTTEDSLPVSTTNSMLNMIHALSDYDKLASAVSLKSTLNPVRTSVSVTNLAFDGVQEKKNSAYHLRKKFIRNAHSATNMQSMGERPRFSSTDNVH